MVGQMQPADRGTSGSSASVCIVRGCWRWRSKRSPLAAVPGAPERWWAPLRTEASRLPSPPRSACRSPEGGHAEAREVGLLRRGLLLTGLACTSVTVCSGGRAGSGNPLTGISSMLP
jgi:hypothetical protein